MTGPMVTGGALVVRSLQEAGVRTAFGINGAHVDSVYQAALDSGLRIVDTRHEMNAGHAAEGYARVTGEVGAAILTAGGGFTNGLTSIANAFMDRTPVVYIAGSGPLDLDQTNDLQAGIDQVAMATPVTKWAHRVTRTEHIPRLLAQAIRIASAAPRGPVLLDIPWDVLRGEVDPLSIQATGVEAITGSGISDEVVTDIIDRIDHARRPIVIVGSEVARGAAREQLGELSTALDLPLFADFEGLSQISGHPNSFGLLQSLISLEGVERPDLVLLLGVRFGLATAGGRGSHIPLEATVIQVDPDARELGRLQEVAVGVTADVTGVIDRLLGRAARAQRPDRDAWKALLGQLVEDRASSVGKELERGARIHPYDAVETIASCLTAETTLVADGALTYLWLSESVSRRPIGRFLCHGYFGSMGVGLGTAIGAKVADPTTPVVLVTGDGSVGYSLGEFDTMVRADVPVVVVVLNNRAWGATLHAQQIIHGPDRIVNNRLDNGSYAAAARALGADGYDVTELGELASTLERALASNRPACIDVQVDLDPIPPEERVLMGQLPF